jgi:hypothetical protein
MTMKRKRVILTVVVLIAAAATAWLFGAMAGAMYGVQVSYSRVEFNRPLELIGQWWGACTGLLAGMVWCRFVLHPSRRDRLVSAGAWTGLMVGVLSTVLLHAVLMAVSERVDAFPLVVGLVFGVVAGLLVGAICGAICRAVLNPAAPPHAATGAGPTESSGTEATYPVGENIDASDN